MNKFGLAFGVTAVTALVGCLDPKYVAQKKTVVTTTPAPLAPAAVVEPVVEPVPVQQPVVIEVVQQPVQPPVVVTPVQEVKPLPEPETTTYIIQPGDTLSKISKRYNITISAIQRANPQIKGDVVRLGQKIKLPGKVEVGEQTVPRGATPKPVVKEAKPYVPYTGATKEYVVKGGDVLGTIAQKNGCSVRQLKELNGLSTDIVRVGQKLKVPAEKAAASVVEKKIEKKVEKPVEPSVEAPKVEKKKDVVQEPVVEDQPVVEPPQQPATPADDFVTYTVQEGEDITSISIQTYVSPSEIRQLNNLSDDAQLVPGMVLKLPAGSLQ